MLTMERVWRTLLGVALGLMLAVLYLEYNGVTSEALDQLRKAAFLLMVISFVLGFWPIERPTSR